MSQETTDASLVSGDVRPSTTDPALVDEIRAAQKRGQVVMIELDTVEADTLNDPSAEESRQFFETIFTMVRLGFPVQISAPTERARDSLRKHIEVHRLDNDIQRAAGARIHVAYFGENGVPLVRAISNDFRPVSYVGGRERIEMIADKLPNAALIIARSGLAGKALLAFDAALLGRVDFQITGAHSNVYEPGDSFYFGIGQKLDALIRATQTILKAA